MNLDFSPEENAFRQEVRAFIKAAKSDSNVIDIAAGAENNGTTVPLPIIERETSNGRERVAIIDPEYVRQMVASIVKDQDLSRYIL